jgi:hypothetical protein
VRGFVGVSDKVLIDCDGMLVFQRFVAFAYPTVPKKMTAMPAATDHAGTSRRFFAANMGAAKTRALSAGQTATHSIPFHKIAQSVRTEFREKY